MVMTEHKTREQMDKEREFEGLTPEDRLKNYQKVNNDLAEAVPRLTEGKIQMDQAEHEHQEAKREYNTRKRRVQELQERAEWMLRLLAK